MNIRNIQNDVNLSNIGEWIRKFKSLISVLDDKAVALIDVIDTEVTLVFSDEEIDSQYGLSNSKAIEEFFERYPDIPEDRKNEIRKENEPEFLYQLANLISQIYGIDSDAVRAEIKGLRDKIRDTTKRDGGKKAGSYNPYPHHVPLPSGNFDCSLFPGHSQWL